MTWFAAIPAIFASIAILLIPGLLVTSAIGLRGLWAVGLGPVVSTTLWVGGATLLPYLGLDWSPAPAAAVVAIFGLLVVVLFRWVLRTTFVSRTVTDTQGLARWATAIAYGIGAAIISTLFVLGVGAPEAISQTYDNIFHLNLLAFTVDTGNASALSSGHMITTGTGIAFYPNAWHALVTMVQMLTGSSIPLALTGFNFTVAVVVWPLGALLLVRQFVGSSSTTMLIAGVVLATFPAMPLNLLHYGVLYPFFLGMVLAPALLAIVAQLFGMTRESPIGTTTGLAVLALGSIPGVAISHPGAMMAVLALAVPLVLVAGCSGWKLESSKSKLFRAGGLAVFLAVGSVLLIKARPSFESAWAPQLSLLQTLGQTFGLGFIGYGLPVLLAIFVVIGLIVAARRRGPVDVVLISMWSVAALLFVTAAWVPFWRIRVFLAGVWYADLPRLAAIFVLVLIPLSVLGATWVFSVLKGKLPARGALAAILMSVLLVGILASGGWVKFIGDMRSSYAMTETSPLISLDEQRLLDQLPSLVPEGSVIVGNPWTGTALAYALGERDVILRHVSIVPDDQGDIILRGLRWADTRPEVCEVIREVNAFYVLDFGFREVHGAKHQYPGIENLQRSDAVELVAAEGDAKLYRVTACD